MKTTKPARTARVYVNDRALVATPREVDLLARLHPGRVRVVCDSAR